jgi:electron-transferring-flavoprotein dehydrogenase
VNADAPELEPRESMDFDVVIVGAGPAGLAAAIRLRQLAEQQGRDLSVVVLEKGSEVGAHILSGAVMDPIGLDRLIPDWKDRGAPVTEAVKTDQFLYLTATRAVPLPNALMPPLMSNHGNYIVSLGDVVRWLGAQAEAAGVEIYPGFAASEILTDVDGAVSGVATGDMGVGRDGAAKASFVRGMELRGKYTLIAEGARGSLAKQLIARFSLDATSDPQKFGIGIKELWRVAPERHRPGLVQHTFGWPLDNATGGGSFLYHSGDNLVAVGFVVHLNYRNPWLSPFDEFQRFKTHPAICGTFENGERLCYGARALTEGGWQSIPKLAFPGGALLGCAAGFMNLPRIKGSHNAILSGIHAAEAAFAAIAAGRAHDRLDAYEPAVRDGDIGRDLRRVRNVKPLWSRFGTVLGAALGGLDMWVNTIRPSGGLGITLRHGKPDSDTLRPAADCPLKTYPKPDGKLTFDRLTSVSFSGTNHEEDQPVHLRLADPDVPIRVNLPEFGEPAQRYCPAGVYEVIGEGAKARFQINTQNCVHCKTCDIKDPARNITWTCPEGGGGPNYSGM